jgi:hypothetical protein
LERRDPRGRLVYSRGSGWVAAPLRPIGAILTDV